MRQYRHNPDQFFIAYHRASRPRLNPFIEEEIKKQLMLDQGLIDDPTLPIDTYEYGGTITGCTRWSTRSRNSPEFTFEKFLTGKPAFAIIDRARSLQGGGIIVGSEVGIMSGNGEKLSQGPSSEQVEVEFHFEKSQFFRVIRVDGAWGGVTHRGDIHMGLFSEYPPLPETVKHVIVSGKLADEVGRKMKSGIVREIEVEAVMRLATAIALRDWLSLKIEEAQKSRQQE